ncbi:MAG TPA: hypothetical protein VM658_02430 [bacterium]|nr:hypothetical protein [bacterium]
MAREIFNKAEMICKQIGYKLGEANILMGLGDIELAEGNKKLAIKDYENARLIFQLLKMIEYVKIMDNKINECKKTL